MFVRHYSFLKQDINEEETWYAKKEQRRKILCQKIEKIKRIIINQKIDR